MKRKPQFILTGHMVRDISAKSAGERLLHRLHCVALVFHGFSASKVGQIFDDSPRAVSYWVRRFKQRGLDGLQEESRPGRPPKLNPIQLNKLQTFVRRLRATSKPVNAPVLVAYISKEFKIVLTTRQCWRILKRLKT